MCRVRVSIDQVGIYKLYIDLIQTMGNVICCGLGSSEPLLSEEEKEERRIAARRAAEERGTRFAQGGGGGEIKKRAKKREEAKRKNAQGRQDGHPALNNARHWD